LFVSNDMQNNDEIKKLFQESFSKIVRDYLEAEKDKGKTINDVDPWGSIESFLSETIENPSVNENGFAPSSAGTTAALLIIEQELNVAFKDSYADYLAANPIENKFENFVKKEMKRVIGNLIEGMDEEKIVKDNVCTFGFIMWNKSLTWV